MKSQNKNKMILLLAAGVVGLIIAYQPTSVAAFFGSLAAGAAVLIAAILYTTQTRKITFEYDPETGAPQGSFRLRDLLRLALLLLWHKVELPVKLLVLLALSTGFVLILVHRWVGLF